LKGRSSGLWIEADVINVKLVKKLFYKNVQVTVHG